MKDELLKQELEMFILQKLEDIKQGLLKDITSGRMTDEKAQFATGQTLAYAEVVQKIQDLTK